MVEDNEKPPEARNGDEAYVARLLRLAGPRPDIPPLVEKRVHRRVRAEWEQSRRRRRVTRIALPLALAASVVIGIMLVPQRSTTPARPVVGTVVRTLPAAGDGLPAVGTRLTGGQALRTAGGHSLSVELRGGRSLRIAPATVVTLVAFDRVRLGRGEIYADTGPSAYAADPLTVDTAAATITDVGTQFAVRIEDDALRVAVREGRVDVVTDGNRLAASAGELLRLAQGGQPQREAIGPDAELWRWAMEVAPVFDIENRSLMEFLQWAARETGRKLTFANDAVRASAMRAILHGSIEGLSPDEAVDSVLATSGLTYRVTAREIVIGAGTGEGRQ